MEIDTGKTGLHKFRGTFLRNNGKGKNPADPVDPVICVLFFGESWDRYYSSLPNKFVKEALKKDDFLLDRISSLYIVVFVA